MVDLDGALAGQSVNASVFFSVAKHTNLLVEVGGGIRSMETIEAYIEGGIRRVILGSAAIGNPELVAQAAAAFGDRVAVGIDARNEMVSGSGWTQDSAIHYLDMAKRMEEAGVKTLIYTDISKDGTLSGPNPVSYTHLDVYKRQG